MFVFYISKFKNITDSCNTVYIHRFKRSFFSICVRYIVNYIFFPRLAKKLKIAEIKKNKMGIACINFSNLVSDDLVILIPLLIFRGRKILRRYRESQELFHSV